MELRKVVFGISLFTPLAFIAACGDAPQPAAAALTSAAEVQPFATDALEQYARSARVGLEAALVDQAPAALTRPAIGEWETGGSGGETGFQERTFRAANGKSAKWKARFPDDIGADKSYGLLIYLHGDGGADYNWFFSRVETVAKKHNLVPVAVMSPTSNSNGPSWWWDADRNAAFLDELLKSDLGERYNIDRSRVIFTGASGGPTFLSGPWLRHYASQYRGGAVLFCGGLVSTNLSFQDAPGFKENFKIFIYTGTSDFLYQGARSSAAYYTNQGMSVTAEYPRGISHCGFSSYMDRLLDERVSLTLRSGEYAGARDEAGFAAM